MANPDGAKDVTASKTPPTPAKKGKPEDEDGPEDASANTKQPRQKLLPTGLSRAVVIAGVLVSLTMLATDLLAGRYQLVPAPNSANSFMYRIDSLTGAIKFCGPQSCTDVQTVAGK